MIRGRRGHVNIGPPLGACTLYEHSSWPHRRRSQVLRRSVCGVTPKAFAGFTPKAFASLRRRRSQGYTPKRSQVYAEGFAGFTRKRSQVYAEGVRRVYAEAFASLRRRRSQVSAQGWNNPGNINPPHKLNAESVGELTRAFANAFSVELVNWGLEPRVRAART